MRFEIKNRYGTPSSESRPLVLLRKDSWDDFGYKTLFDVEIYLADGTSVELGGVKIIHIEQRVGATKFNSDEFNELGKEYCSLGQSTEYYERLAKLPKLLREEYLRAMRDAVFEREIRSAFSHLESWDQSLVRFGQAAHALESAGPLVRRRTPKITVGKAKFNYVRNGASEFQIGFAFDDTTKLPGRSNVIIGYNGVGKTRLLAEIARAVSEPERSSESGGSLEGKDTTFGSVIAVSYSAFDNFQLPQDKARGQSRKYSVEDADRTELFGYVYCGLRRLDLKSSKKGSVARSELKSLDELDNELLKAFTGAKEREIDRENVLGTCLKLLQLEPSFGRIGVHLLDWLDEEYDVLSQIKRLSTGHKIVLNIVVQLAAHLSSRSLVLLDEPETHLHPPLLATLLKVLQELLTAFDSFVIVATHSPVVLQEVPASSVRLLKRFGDESSVAVPEIETFGANVGSITRHVFSLDSTATDFQGVLSKLARTMEIEEIEESLFPQGLSNQARALVLRAKRVAR